MSTATYDQVATSSTKGSLASSGQMEGALPGLIRGLRKRKSGRSISLVASHWGSLHRRVFLKLCQLIRMVD